MGSKAAFSIIIDTKEKLVIRDDGPWSEHRTITNDAEQVVSALAGDLKGRRLFYFDSTGELDELLVSGGKFTGFRPARELKPTWAAIAAALPVRDGVTRCPSVLLTIDDWKLVLACLADQIAASDNPTAERIHCSITMQVKP